MTIMQLRSDLDTVDYPCSCDPCHQKAIEFNQWAPMRYSLTVWTRMDGMPTTIRLLNPNRYLRERPPRGTYSGPQPKPGQTVMLCPTERSMMVWDFQPDDMQCCTGCGYLISREDAT